MMKKTSAYDKWIEIEDKYSQNPFNFVRANVLPGRDSDVFFQIDCSRTLGIMIHLSKMVDDMHINIDLKGIKAWMSIDPTIDKKNSVIQIINKIEKDNNLFKAFSATLFENLNEATSSRLAYDVVVSTIEDYKKYFDGKKVKLGLKEQQGLFGELLFIDEQLDKGNSDVIKYWEGVNKNKHDFVFEDESVEIKSTHNLGRLDIHISNEMQLDNSLCRKLILRVYKLDVIEAGRSIFDLYQEISNKLNKVELTIFEGKLLQAGVDISGSTEYYRFKKLETHNYLVDDQFPKLTKEDLNARIFDTKYYVNLDGIEEISYE